MKEAVIKGLDDLIADFKQFHNTRIFPLSAPLKRELGNPGRPVRNFEPSNLAELLFELEKDIRYLEDSARLLKKKPKSIAARNALEDFALSLAIPVEYKKDLSLEHDNYEETYFLTPEYYEDAVTSYLKVLAHLEESHPEGMTYERALINCILVQSTHDTTWETAQIFRENDIGDIFQEYAALIEKHLSKGTVLGNLLGIPEIKEKRDIPNVKKAFTIFPKKGSSLSGKGYKSVIESFKRSKKWNDPKTKASLRERIDDYNKRNSTLETHNRLYPKVYQGSVFFEKYTPTEMRISGIRGYHSQKNGLRNLLDRFSTGGLINHIALIGPPGTGKTSLFLAMTAKYKGIKFLFTDEYFDETRSAKDLQKIVRRLNQYDKKFLIYADDTKYEGSKKLAWESFRTLLEGTTNVSPNIRILLSTNHWDQFPAPFRSRFGDIIKMGYPDRRTQKSIAKYHKQLYGVEEGVDQILVGAEHIAETNQEKVTGRSIEQFCFKNGIFRPNSLNQENLTKKEYPNDDIPF